MTDRIRIEIERNDEIAGAVESFGDYIASQTLAVSVDVVDKLDDAAVSVDLDEFTVRMKVTRI